MIQRLLSWIQDAPGEEDRAVGGFVDEEHEGAVHIDGDSFLNSGQRHGHTGGGGCLGATLVHIHEGFVHDLRNEKITTPGDA